jgi:hypothetical protein
MNVSITITLNGHIEMALFEKSQDLYLYISTPFAHPKRMLTGLIFGNFLHIL